ncbi:TonB-dependent receptor domain-containing protein [Rubrivirga sp.]|uniref:TonB-dependent receptor domain-containing protein n=1 Tax=Rubrivirga sp. TaxID=1885344 RepID=UPI003C794012
MIRSLSTAVLLLLLALPSVALAQNSGKLSGRVTDAETGDPLIGANVFLADISRGAATDIDGNYTILGIPVGAYAITYSYTGYQTETLTGVEISQGRTRTVDVELSGQSIGEVIVEYERPLIQRDAIGVPKVVTGEDIQNLPVRGVQSVAAIQAGVVSNDGSNTLNIRGGRGEEVDYYVDGVKVVGSTAVPQQAIAEQEMLIGTIPPQYGDATAGVISISTRGGGNAFFGAAEAITSYGLDSFGYTLGSLSLGGPIIRDRVSFFGSVQGTFQEDASPYALETLQLNDDIYNALQSSPQVIRVDRNGVDQNGVPLDLSGATGAPLFEDENFVYFPFPAGFNTDGGSVTPDSLGAILGFNGDHPGDFINGFRRGYDFVSDESFFSTRSGKDDPSTEIAASGNIDIRPVTGVSLRLGGAYVLEDDQSFSYSRSLFNRDQFSQTDDEVIRGYVSLRQVLSNTAFYQLQAEYSTRNLVEHPNSFSDDVRDALFYGDIDNEANAVARRYFSTVTTGDEAGNTTNLFSDGNLGVDQSLGFTFSGPGSVLSTYDRFSQDQFRVFGNAQTQIGVHELSFGGEYETLTQRRYFINTTRFARYFEDGTAEVSGAEIRTVDTDGDGQPDRGVSSWEELEYEDGFEASASYYGYNFNGTEQVDDGNVTDFTSGANRNIAPYEPIYYGGYVRDRIEYQDIVLDLGLRLDVFDNNTLVLRDPYALVDIFRVDDLRAGIFDEQGAPRAIVPDNIPGNIEGDFAFYQNGGDVVGYRDLEGQFYNLNGEEVPFDEIQQAGQPIAESNELSDDAFRDYDPALTLMPRIGVTFPVTDRALFFASYNVTSQRPSENAFATIRDYANVASSSGTLNNANLRPETTTQYELGFRQRIGQQAALTLSGFYRTQRNKVTLRNLDQAFPAGYTGYTNLDFTTTKGLEVAFDLRRTRNLSVNANYTLSFAEGTGSDSRTARIIAWRSATGVFPETLAPLAFDRRHNLNLSLDYRLGEGEGPMLGGIRPFAGFGFNLLGVLQSGSPYTQLDDQALQSPIFQSTNGGAVGAVNSVYLPFTSRLDLRVDRNFNLGPANFKGYVWVQNLLNQDQVYSVYRDTGLPDDDGFLATNPDVVRNLPTDLERDAFRFLYSQYVNSPVVLDTFGQSGGRVYGLPRRIRLGVTLDF